MKDKPDTVNCRDECGRSIPAEQVQSAGWEYLQIQKRYRCTECWRALRLTRQPRDNEGSEP